MTSKSKVSPLIFVATLVCFLFPFVTVSCGDHKVTSFTGVQLATGTTVPEPQMFGPPKKREVAPDPFAAVAVLAAAVGMCLGFVGARSAIPQAICGGLGALLLLLMKARTENQVLQQGQGLLVVSYEPGFTLALLLLIAAAGWNAYLAFAGKRASTAPAAAAAYATAAGARGDPIGLQSQPGSPQPQTQAPRTDATAADARQFCPNCGKEASVGSKFCRQCGGSLA